MKNRYPLTGRVPGGWSGGPVKDEPILPMNIKRFFADYIAAPAILCWFMLLALVELVTLPFSRDDLNREDE